MKQKKSQSKNEVHVPMRMCAVTREKLPKKELLRFVLLSDNAQVRLEMKEKLRGRGLNIKPSLEVFDEAIKRKVFERTFKTKIKDIESLRKDVEEYIEEKYGEKKVIRVTAVELNNLKNKVVG